MKIAPAAVGNLLEHLEKQLFFRLCQNRVDSEGTLKKPGGAGGVDDSERRSLGEQ